MPSVIKNQFLKYLREIDDFYNVTFQFKYGKNINVWKEKPVKEIKAHKIVLVAFSVTFKAQFCGELAKQNRNGGEMEVVTLTDFTPTAYNILFKLIYGDIAVIASCDDPQLLFHVYGLAMKYQLVDEIMKTVKQRMADLKVTWRLFVKNI